MPKKKNSSNFSLMKLVSSFLIIGILVFLGRGAFNHDKEKESERNIMHNLELASQQLEEVLALNEGEFQLYEDNTRDLDNLANKGYVYDMHGPISTLSDSASYKVLPRAFTDKINTRLKGIFYGNSEGNVLYKVDTFQMNPLTKIQNYAITYSKIDDQNMDNIKRYDMAILEPLNISKEQVTELEQASTKIYGYQSIFEIDPGKFDEENKPLSENDFLYLNGTKQISSYYNYYYGDIRSKGYRALLFEEIEKNIIDKGFTGVFFDTLDNLETSTELTKAMEDDSNQQIEEELFEGYLSFFRELNFKYPQLSIILNRAFNSYNKGLGEYSDGLMFENLDSREFEDPATADFYNNTLVPSINKTAIHTDGVVLGLSYRDQKKNYQLAKKFNWLYFYYDEVNNKDLSQKETIDSIVIQR